MKSIVMNSALITISIACMAVFVVYGNHLEKTRILNIVKNNCACECFNE